MSYASVMMYAVQLDTWRQRFKGIVEYNKLSDSSGYKFAIRNDACYLDPPFILQHISRWYYGYSKEQFLAFMEEKKPHFFTFLNDVYHSDVLHGKSMPARDFIKNLVFYVSELARAFSVCRNMYPGYEKLNLVLLEYYHGIREWLGATGY